VARGTAERPARRAGRLGLSDAHADRMRRLRAGPDDRAQAAGCRDRVRDRACAHRAAAGAAVDLPGCVRLPGVRAPGRPARPRSIYALPRRIAHRPLVPVHRLALSELAVRARVHARELRHRSAGAGGGAVGIQGRGGDVEPRSRCADRACVRASGPQCAMGSGVRGAEPGAAGAGRWRRPQRHDRAGAARARSAGERGSEPTDARRGMRARGRRRSQADRRAGAPLPGARIARAARACPRGTERHMGASGGRGRRGGRLRCARAWLPGRGRRAAAARGHAQHPGGDGPPGRSQRHPGLVAPPVRGRIRARPVACAVAYGTRGGLAGGGGLDDARAARVHGLAAAVVCGVAAPASGRQLRSAPVCRHARVLRLCGPHPPAAGRRAPEPRDPQRLPAHPRRRPPPAPPPGTRRFPDL
jgi:hypothetical protein